MTMVGPGRCPQHVYHPTDKNVIWFFRTSPWLVIGADSWKNLQTLTDWFINLTYIKLKARIS